MTFRDRIDALLGHECNECVGLSFEQVRTGAEVSLALEFNDGAHVAADRHADHALSCIAVFALGAGGQTLFTEPLLGGLHVAVVFLQRFLAVHHAGA